MTTRTIDQLEQELRSDEHREPGHLDLETVRAAGMRRRHLSAAAMGAGLLATSVAACLVLSAVLGGGSGRANDDPAPAAHPQGLSGLAERVLAEVPGAAQVSEWQVVMPEPAGAKRMWSEPDLDVVGTPVDTGAHHYSGVTGYRAAAFPAWLYDGVERIEHTELASEDGSYPVGSTEMGVLVDGGPAYLGCVGDRSGCGPALLTRTAGGWAFEWGMGTDDFLKPGSDMEVFLSDDYSTGAPGQLVLAGLPGTDVARVDLVTTDGTTVPGHVESGTIVDGDTMMWGTVVGGLAAVVAYDAAGEVIEDHELKPCSDPVDCEVR
jgi:hypothetical protein